METNLTSMYASLYQSIMAGKSDVVPITYLLDVPQAININAPTKPNINLFRNINLYFLLNIICSPRSIGTTITVHAANHY